MASLHKTNYWLNLDTKLLLTINFNFPIDSVRLLALWRLLQLQRAC